MAWYKPIIDGIVEELKDIFGGQADEVQSALDEYIEEDRLRQEAIIEKLDAIYKAVGDVNENVIKAWALEQTKQIDAIGTELKKGQ